MAVSAGPAEIAWDRCHTSNALSLVLVPRTRNHVLHRGVTVDSEKNLGISLRLGYEPPFRVQQAANASQSLRTLHAVLRTARPAACACHLLGADLYRTNCNISSAALIVQAVLPCA